MNALEKLRETVELIRAKREPLKLLDQWALAGRLLARFPADQASAAEAVAKRDLEALDALVARLERPAPKTDDEAPPVSEAEMEHALHAFRKRLKVMRLADESRLGGRYTSGGKKSGIDAIQPPTEIPAHVWKALARAGKLKDTGQGFYAET